MCEAARLCQHHRGVKELAPCKGKPHIVGARTYHHPWGLAREDHNQVKGMAKGCGAATSNPQLLDERLTLIKLAVLREVCPPCLVGDSA